MTNDPQRSSGKASASPAFLERLQAFGRDCVAQGDMTPAAARMLERIIADEASSSLRA